MKSTRNTLAGNHPSYTKRGMTPAQIAAKRKYDSAYHATPERKAYRAKLNAANKAAGSYGNGDRKDMSHTKSGRLVKEDQSKNRARNRGRK